MAAPPVELGQEKRRIQKRTRLRAGLGTTAEKELVLVDFWKRRVDDAVEVAKAQDREWRSQNTNNTDLADLPLLGPRAGYNISRPTSLGPE